MPVRIRLSRGGAKKRPYYRIVVADSRRARDGKFIEQIGTYNPMLTKDNPERVKVDLDKAKDWIGKGAQPSNRVQLFLSSMGVGEKPAASKLDWAAAASSFSTKTPMTVCLPALPVNTKPPLGTSTALASRTVPMKQVRLSYPDNKSISNFRGATIESIDCSSDSVFKAVPTSSSLSWVDTKVSTWVYKSPEREERTSSMDLTALVFASTIPAAFRNLLTSRLNCSAESRGAPMLRSSSSPS